MTNNNGGGPILPVPDLANLRSKQGGGGVSHHLVTVRSEEGEQVLDFLVSEVGVTPTGALALVTDGRLVGAYSPAMWLAFRRADVVPEPVE